MADISKCQEGLLRLAKQQGYLTFDDILNASDTFSLSVTEVDILSEAIQLRGSIVYETAPQIAQGLQTDEEVLDYSRTDYDGIFNEILEIAPQLNTLVAEIKSFPAPQWGEVNQLVMQVGEGNRFARDRVIMLYMRNVLKIALSMTKQYSLDLEDAISSGFIGLMNAVDRFDPSGFSAFHSYASLWIQQGIQRDCNPVWIDYYFPAHYKERMFRSLQKYYQYSCGESVGSKEYYLLVQRIAQEIELSELDVDKALRSAFSQMYGKESVEELIELEDSDGICMDRLVSNEDYFNEQFNKELSEIIKNALSSLSEREALVIRMRNGIGYNAPMTLEEIGFVLNVTRERIRQIEAKALRKLAHPSRAKKLRPILDNLYE